MLTLLLLAALLFAAYQIYAYQYFRSHRFLAMKEAVAGYTLDCNELNDHIEQLKYSQSHAGAVDYGAAQLADESRHNFKRTHWSSSASTKHVYNCSSSVCKRAGEQPFKYLCKYFNIKPSERTLDLYESMLNDFAAAEQGKSLLIRKKNEIIASISDKVPALIKRFSAKRLERNLGFEPIDFSDYYVPVFTFKYVSAGGNSAMSTSVRLDLDNIERFVRYLADLVKFRKSVAGQRALMTQALRDRIKERDDYTCCNCGLSAHHERNLLLEIDHIRPLSKGGLTTEGNLQTLCWKCNRQKGAKFNG